MARQLSPIKEQLLTAYRPTETNRKSSVAVVTDSTEDFSLECLLKATQVDSKRTLVSRITYGFPLKLSIRSREALRFAEIINGLLKHSQVFVMQNLDSDRRYSLRMDTLLEEPYEKEGIARFLDNITSDIEVIVQYFHHRATV